jgi:hypothetical protein
MVVTNEEVDAHSDSRPDGSDPHRGPNNLAFGWPDIPVDAAVPLSFGSGRFHPKQHAKPGDDCEFHGEASLRLQTLNKSPL